MSLVMNKRAGPAANNAMFNLQLALVSHDICTYYPRQSLIFWIHIPIMTVRDTPEISETNPSIVALFNDDMKSVGSSTTEENDYYYDDSKPSRDSEGVCRSGLEDWIEGNSYATSDLEADDPLRN